jgi:hypothetical protein
LQQENEDTREHERVCSITRDAIAEHEARLQVLQDCVAEQQARKAELLVGRQQQAEVEQELLKEEQRLQDELKAVELREQEVNERVDVESSKLRAAEVRPSTTCPNPPSWSGGEGILAQCVHNNKRFLHHCHNVNISAV